MSQFTEQATTAAGSDQLSRLRDLVDQCARENRLAEAVDECKRICDELANALGIDHPDVAAALSILARVYRLLSAYVEAANLLDNALAIRKRKLRESDPLSIAATLNELAEVRADNGELGEAERSSKEAMVIRVNHLGPAHVDVGDQLDVVASICQQRGKCQEAEWYYRRALDIREAQPAAPDNQSRVKQIEEKLASCLLQQGKYKDAEVLYQRELSAREAVRGGSDHPDVAQLLDRLGWVRSQQEKYQQAEQDYLRAIRIFEASLGPHDHQVAWTKSNLAQCYMKQGLGDLAEVLCRQVLRILGDGHPDFAAKLEDLAIACCMQDKPAQAEIYYRGALEIYEARAAETGHDDDEDPNVAATRNCLLSCYLEQAKFGEAERLLNEVPLLPQAMATDDADGRQTTFLEIIMAELRDELAEKTQRLAHAQRSIDQLREKSEQLATTQRTIVGQQTMVNEILTEAQRTIEELRTEIARKAQQLTVFYLG